MTTLEQENLLKKQLLIAFSSFNEKTVIDFLDKNIFFGKNNKKLIIDINESTINSSLIIEQIEKIEKKSNHSNNLKLKLFEKELINKSNNLDVIWDALPEKYQLKVLDKYNYSNPFTSNKINILSNNFSMYKDKTQIINWLKKYKIKSYTLIEDAEFGFVVNLSSSLSLYNKKLFHIPVKFNRVKEFLVHNNHLTSLKFSPNVVDGRFCCSYNNIGALEELPVKLGGTFLCKNNPLLGDLQYIKDLNELKKEISKIKEIKNFSERLEKNLEDKKVNKKIKI